MKKLIGDKYRRKFDANVMHPIQSYAWGEFREHTGVEVVRYGVYDGREILNPIQVSIHPIGIGRYSVGYAPKGYIPDMAQTKVLKEIAREHRCIYIKVEPKAEKSSLTKQKKSFMDRNGYVRGREMFTRFNFVLDLDKGEEAMLSQMKSKTRYNIGLAERKGVVVSEDNSDEVFEKYLELTKETTDRQGFYAHSEDYHRKMWTTLRKEKIARLLKAEYKGEILTVWVLFFFGDSVYYPYGASSRKHREVMANNLLMWEAVKLAKKEGYGYFDMWGALGPDPEKNDSWYGFHKFKEGYGARHVEYVGTYDLVNMPVLYRVFRIAEILRWIMLRLIKSRRR